MKLFEAHNDVVTAPACIHFHSIHTISMYDFSIQKHVYCSFTCTVCNIQQHLYAYTYLTVIAVRCRVYLRTTVPANHLTQCILNEILNESRLAQSAKKRPFDNLKELWVSCLDIASQVPRQMCHRNDRLHTLNLVVLVSLDCKLILSPG